MSFRPESAAGCGLGLAEERLGLMDALPAEKSQLFLFPPRRPDEEVLQLHPEPLGQLARTSAGPGSPPPLRGATSRTPRSRAPTTVPATEGPRPISIASSGSPSSARVEGMKPQSYG